MKSKIYLLIALLIVGSLILLPAACKPTATNTLQAELQFVPPSSEELARDNFILPEIPRILCEQLKQIMDRGDAFTLVDARTSDNFKRDYLPGAINIPEDDPSLTQEWVNDQLAVLPEGITTIFYCN